MINKVDIYSLSIDELKNFVTNIGEKSFRAYQIYDWIYNKGINKLEIINNLPKKLHEQLKKFFIFYTLKVNNIEKSIDGTIKYTMQLYDNKIIESVIIPTKNRYTGCISSQVGCSLDCRFCATSKLKNIRNLQIGEIFNQILLLNKYSQKQFGHSLSNLVFMGMGEPLLNYNNVTQSIKKITKSKTLNISHRHITLSTSGIPKMIYKLANEQIKINLALSLHSAREEIRREIMPFSKKISFKDLKESLQYWYNKTKSRITFEYIIWNNINDHIQDIQTLVKFCQSVPSKVNLIEYNHIGDNTFQKGNKNIINKYIDILKKNRIVVKIRYSRGKDINAACGQLSNNNIFY